MDPRTPPRSASLIPSTRSTTPDSVFTARTAATPHRDRDADAAWTPGRWTVRPDTRKPKLVRGLTAYPLTFPDPRDVYTYAPDPEHITALLDREHARVHALPASTFHHLPSAPLDAAAKKRIGHLTSQWRKYLRGQERSAGAVFPVVHEDVYAQTLKHHTANYTTKLRRLARTDRLRLPTPTHHVFAQEESETYTAIVKWKQRLPLHMPQYAEWQREWEARGAVERAGRTALGGRKASSSSSASATGGKGRDTTTRAGKRKRGDLTIHVPPVDHDPIRSATSSTTRPTKRRRDAHVGTPPPPTRTTTTRIGFTVSKRSMTSSCSSADGMDGNGKPASASAAVVVVGRSRHVVAVGVGEMDDEFLRLSGSPVVADAAVTTVAAVSAADAPASPGMFNAAYWDAVNRNKRALIARRKSGGREGTSDLDSPGVTSPKAQSVGPASDTCPLLTSGQFPPLSFPQDLATSTPKHAAQLAAAADATSSPHRPGWECESFPKTTGGKEMTATQNADVPPDPAESLSLSGLMDDLARRPGITSRVALTNGWNVTSSPATDDISMAGASQRIQRMGEGVMAMASDLLGQEMVE